MVPKRRVDWQIYNLAVNDPLTCRAGVANSQNIPYGTHPTNDLVFTPYYNSKSANQGAGFFTRQWQTDRE